VWPAGRSYGGTDFDALARRWLWFVGKDYCHGTGHGVGHFSCVHESPPRLGRSGKLSDNVYQNNMVVTDEPGYYEEGAFGIRIEDQLAVQPRGEDGKQQRFLNLTVVPYDRNLFKMDMISQDYLDYINEYHQRCLKQVAPILKEMGWFMGLSWLEKHCTPILKSQPYDEGAL
jgi:Xaa-Pro aminopeptidase